MLIVEGWGDRGVVAICFQMRVAKVWVLTEQKTVPSVVRY